MAALLRPVPPVPVLRMELLASGWARRRLDGAIASGDLRYVLPGVLLRSDVPLDLSARARAAALVLPDGTVLARRTAAWLMGVDVLPPGAHLEMLPVDTVVPAGRSHTRRGGMAGRSATLPPEDVQLLEGIPVTTPLRTALDLGRLSRREEALVALDAFTHAGLVDVDELRSAANSESLVHQRGVRQLRELADYTEPLTESPGESRTRLKLLDAGFDRPRAQVVVVDVTGRFVARLDLAYEAPKVGVEFDGVEHHTTEVDVRRDARRRSAAERLGWRFVVARKEDVYGTGRGLVEAVGELLGVEPRRSRRTRAA